MTGSLRGIAIAWAVLLVVLATLITISAFPLGRFGPFLVFLPAAAMIAGVGFIFMRLGRTVPLGQVFAVAAIVWLVILMTLGSVDPLTRTDYPVASTRYP